MSHLVSYKWFRRTQYIPRFGGVLQECGDFTWRLSDSWRVNGELLTGDDGLGFRCYSVKVTPLRWYDVPEVLEVHVVASEEVRMVPLSPTATYNGLEVVVEESSFLPQEKMMKLKRSSESGMSICFTWFPFWWFRRTEIVTSISLFYKKVNFTWRLSDSVKN